MNLLITGATGFLGSSLVAAFAQRTETTRIIATGRKLSPEKKIHSHKVHYQLGDLTDETFVHSLFTSSIDVVVNCASLSSPWGSYEQFYKANCLTQKNIIKVSEQASIKRFVYISTPSIYFNFQDNLGITEETPLPQTLVNHYAKTKLEAEQMLNSSSFPYIILRPRALIGKGDTVIMPRLIRSYKEGRLKILGSGKNVVDMTPISSMIQAVWLAATTNETNCQEAYNISNGEPVYLWESINSILNLIGYESLTKKVPYPVLQLVSLMMEKKALWSKSKQEPVLTQYSVGVLAKDFTFDISKAQNRLGYAPTQTTQEAIVEFAEWYNQNVKN